MKRKEKKLAKARTYEKAICAGANPLGHIVMMADVVGYGGKAMTVLGLLAETLTRHLYDVLDALPEDASETEKWVVTAKIYTLGRVIAAAASSGTPTSMDAAAAAKYMREFAGAARDASEAKMWSDRAAETEKSVGASGGGTSV